LLLTILYPPFPADADCCFGSQSLYQLANKKGFCRFTTTPLLKQRKRVRLGLIKVIRSRSPPKAAWYCTPKNVISDIFHITVSRAQPSSVASICLECSPPLVSSSPSHSPIFRLRRFPKTSSVVSSISKPPKPRLGIAKSHSFSPVVLLISILCATVKTHKTALRHARGRRGSACSSA
jgi:hypothetical protein